MNNRLREIVEKKVNSAPMQKQSKNSSLSMNAFKSLAPLILDIHTSFDNPRDQLALAVKSIIERQAELVKQTSLLSGGLTDDEKFVWRRALTIASKEYSNVSTMNSRAILSILANTPNARKISSKLGINQQEIKDLVLAITRYSIYDEKDSFFSTLDSSILKAASKINNAIENINWYSERKSALQVITQGAAIVTQQLLDTQQDIPHASQKSMLKKACITHAGTTLAALLKNSGKNWNYKVKPDDFDVFEEQLSKLAQSYVVSLSYCSKLIVDSLFELESTHSGTPLKESTTGLSVSEMLNSVETLTSMARMNQVSDVADNVQAMRFATILRDTSYIVNYTSDMTEKFLVSLGKDESKSYAKNIFFNAFSPVIRYLNNNEVDFDVRHLKACVNLSVFLLSEQSEINEIINRNGASPNSIIQFRKSRDLAFAIGIDTPFQHRQLIVPTIAEMSSVVMETQQFAWGLSSGYVAPEVCRMLLNATNTLFIANNGKGIGSATSTYRACLEAASSTLSNLWRKHANLTLSSSSRKYTTGAISIEEASDILSHFESDYLNKMHELQYTTNLLRSSIEVVMDNEHNQQPDMQVEP